MLELLRKYQRILFICITFVVVSSFVFFGAFSTFSGGEEKEDVLIGRDVAGSPIHASELQSLIRLLGSDREDSPPNFLNDGVIRYDLLRTGVADVLVSVYSASFQEDLQLRLEKAKRFTPYAHPQMPMLSASAVWGHFLPAINEEIKALKEEKDSSKIFSHLSRLYLQQSALPPETLRKILRAQQRQIRDLPLDQTLFSKDLALFGFHSLSDWFGEKFVSLSAQFILNAAAMAEEKGIHVSSKEAKGDLRERFLHSMQALKEAKVDVELNFSDCVHRLGLDEKAAVEAWRKVLLFRNYFRSVGESAFLDSLSYGDFGAFAKETAVIDEYTWPAAVQPRSALDVVELHLYLKAIALPSSDPLAFPEKLLSLQQVEKNCPELVQSSYIASVASVTKEQVGLHASIKEVWDWQVQDAHWAQLRKEGVEEAKSREERFAALKRLNPQVKAKVDRIARSALVDAHPEWIDAALAKAPKERKEIFVSASSKDKPLAALLEKEGKGPFRHSQDGAVFVQFEEIEKKEPKQIVSLEKAKPALRLLARRQLETEYSKVREKYPDKFKGADGKWKGFLEAQDELAHLVFPALFKEKTPLLAAMKKAKAAIEKKGLDSENQDPLIGQFRLVCTEKRIQRGDAMKKQAFGMLPQQWSEIDIAKEGTVSFFYLKQVVSDTSPLLEQIVFGKQMLSADAQKYLAERVLKKIQENTALMEVP